MRSEAWFLYESGAGPDGLVREPSELGAPPEGEGVAGPLSGSREGNMGQAGEAWRWGWGGGTARGTQDLARRAGCRAVMRSGAPERRETSRATGVEPLDRRPFGDLQFDEARCASDGDYRRRYTRAEAAF